MLDLQNAYVGSPENAIHHLALPTATLLVIVFPGRLVLPHISVAAVPLSKWCGHLERALSCAASRPGVLGGFS